jgi:DNA-binding NtrC family response regulator
VTAAEPSPLASAKAPFVQADPAPCNGPSEKTEKDPFAPGFTPPPAKRSALLFAGRTLQEIEKSMISQALRKSGGNKSAAAKLLGMRRSTFRSKLRRHGMG